MEYEQNNEQVLVTEKYIYRAVDCMLARSDEWEVDLYGIDMKGRGDLIWRTALYAVILQDWELLLTCFELLREYKRWPDWLEPGRKERRRLKKLGYKGFRSQRSMTRDPYIMTLCAIMLMEDINEDQRRSWINQVKIPFWINRPYLRRFKRVLLNKDKLPGFEKVLLRVMKRRERIEPRRLDWKVKAKASDGLKGYIYDRLQNNLGYPAYVKHLHGLMAYVTGAERVKERLIGLVPHWNFAILLLCEKPTMYLLKGMIEAYNARRGFQWSKDEWIDIKDGTKLIPKSEKYKLDKDWLDYLWMKYNEKRKS